MGFTHVHAKTVKPLSRCVSSRHKTKQKLSRLSLLSTGDISPQYPARGIVETRVKSVRYRYETITIFSRARILWKVVVFIVFFQDVRWTWKMRKMSNLFISPLPSNNIVDGSWLRRTTLAYKTHAAPRCVTASTHSCKHITTRPTHLRRWNDDQFRLSPFLPPRCLSLSLCLTSLINSE